MVRLPALSEVVALLQAQTEALAQLPSTLSQLNRTVRGLGEALAQTGETVAAVQRLVIRMERVVGELEPGLTRLARTLDNPVLDLVPEALEYITADALPLVRGLRDTQQKVAAIASSTDRLVRAVDDAGQRLMTLPGASLLSAAARLRTTPSAGTQQPPAPGGSRNSGGA